MNFENRPPYNLGLKPNISGLRDEEARVLAAVMHGIVRCEAVKPFTAVAGFPALGKHRFTIGPRDVTKLVHELVTSRHLKMVWVNHAQGPRYELVATRRGETML